MMLKRSKGLAAVVAATLLSFSAFAAEGTTTVTKADGSYVVTDTLAPREACPAHTPTIVQHYLATGVRQSVTSDVFCGSVVEKVFAADGSLRGSRRFEKQDDGSQARLTSVEFDNQGGDWNRAIVLLSADRQVQSVSVTFGARFHNVTLICNRQAFDNAWRIDELSNGLASHHQVMTVPLIRSALPAEIPTSFTEIQQVWKAALAETTQGSQQAATIQPVHAFSLAAE